MQKLDQDRERVFLNLRVTCDTCVYATKTVFDCEKRVKQKYVVHDRQRVSVTRWLDCFSIYGHLQQRKLSQICHKFAKLSSAFCQLRNKSSKMCQDLKTVAKVAEFCQTWSHCRGGSKYVREREGV